MAELALHARHDRFAVAASVGGEPPPSTVAACGPCGALQRDLLAIRLAIRDAWTPPRPRDLFLTTADAAVLRRAPWRRLLGAIGTSRDTVTRPLAASLTVLGLVGSLLTALPLVSPMTSAPAMIEVVPYTVDVAGESRPPVGGPDAAPHGAAQPDAPPGVAPLAVLSGGLLGAGAGLFVARRVAAAGRRGRQAMR